MARTAIGFAIAFALVSVVLRGRAPGPGSIPDWAPPFLAVVLSAGMVAWLAMPLIKAWAKRIEGRAADTVTLDDLAEMREHMAELDLTSARVQELEERLDFAERMLAQRHDAPPLPLHRTPV